MQMGGAGGSAVVWHGTALDVSWVVITDVGVGCAVRRKYRDLRVG
jgi:hypothetical protein